MVREMVRGIANKVLIDEKPYWNVFFDIDTSKENIEIIKDVLDNIYITLEDYDLYLSPYIIVETTKGYHVVTLCAYPKEIEIAFFYLIKHQLRCNNIDVDYIHYIEFRKLKEDFKVLRISPKPITDILDLNVVHVNINNSIIDLPITSRFP